MFRCILGLNDLPHYWSSVLSENLNRTAAISLEEIQSLKYPNMLYSLLYGHWSYADLSLIHIYKQWWLFKLRILYYILYHPLLFIINMQSLWLTFAFLASPRIDYVFLKVYIRIFQSTKLYMTFCHHIVQSPKFGHESKTTMSTTRFVSVAFQNGSCNWEETKL